MSYNVISIKHVTVTYHSQPVLWDVSGTIPLGTMAAIVGPNGAGKTTLLKAMVGLVKVEAGTIWYGGVPYAQVRDRVAYIPQRKTVDWHFPATVLDVVSMGRYGKIGWFKRPSPADYESCYKALEAVDMVLYANRHISQLSGGQQQRIFIARALAQDADIYLMDEPFMGIDTVTEKSMIDLFKRLVTQGKTIIIVHHDIHTVRTYFDWLWLINTHTIACGPLAEVLTNSYLAATYHPDYSPLDRE